jgi:hypothetical protein
VYTQIMNAELYAHLQMVLSHHGLTCPLPTKAILLHPSVLEHAGFDAVDGVPVRGADHVPEKAAHIDCDGSTLRIDEELAELLNAPVGV